MSKNDAEQTFETCDIAHIDANSIGVRNRGSRRRVRTINSEPSLTKQADRDRANIHNILKRAEKTGLLPQRVAQPLAGDFVTPESFHEAMNLIANAQQQFDALPVSIRDRFEHDPSKLLHFLKDDTNRDEAVKLGLVNPSTEAVEQGSGTPTAPSPERAHNAGVGEGAAPEGGK